MAREYKDSGIEWIGQIPKEWNEKRLKYSCKLFGRIGFRGYTADDLVAEGEGAITISPSNMNGIDLDFSHCSYLSWSKYEESPEIMVRVGDVLLVKTASVGKCSYVGSMPMECTVNPQILVLKEHKDCPKYIAYIFQTALGQAYIDVTKGGTTISTISQEKIGNYAFPFPSLSEQEKIVDYLDKVCGEVDEMVALQETMIEELKAYKQSVITEAVTKGLNPNVPMRNSGIDWIGEIPEHWEAKKLKYIIDYIESGTSVNAGNVPAQTNEFGVLKTSAVSKYVFDATENKTVVSEEMDKVSCPVRKNTIIVSRMNTPELVGACGYVENDYNNIFLPDRLWQVHFVETVYVKYIWYALRGSNIRNYYSSLSVGSSSSMQNISQSQFSNGSIPIPCDVDEQRALVSYLDTKCSEIDSLIALKQAKIEELKEYKKSVIYEYVTGKKEVV